MKSVIPFLPLRLASAVQAVRDPVSELRIIENSPLQVMSEGRLKYLNGSGQTVFMMADCPQVSRLEVGEIYERMLESTRYDQRERAAGGCILLDCGLRVGVAGYRANASVTDISALVIRFCKEYKNCSSEIFGLLMEKGLCSVLIISKPAMGKTTILRDLIQKLSDRKIKCCVVDTTLEISGCGIKLGSSTVTLKGYEKLCGAVSAVKYLSPDILVFDEITSLEDIQAIKYSSAMGVPIIATCHARSPSELARRDDIYECIEKRLFDHIAVIGDRLGRIDRIMDAEELCTKQSERF